MQTHQTLSPLYGILNISQLAKKQAQIEKAHCAIEQGLSTLQLRCKGIADDDAHLIASKLKALCNQHQCQLIINDDKELAKACASDGLHIGQSDGALSEAHAALGKALIGVTCHDSLSLAQEALNAGAGYVAFGRFYPSKTKPEAAPADIAILQKAREQLTSPTNNPTIVAIGGITPDNAAPLLSAGAHSLAVIHALFQDEDSCDLNYVQRQCERFFELLDKQQA